MEGTIRDEEEEEAERRDSECNDRVGDGELSKGVAKFTSDNISSEGRRSGGEKDETGAAGVVDGSGMSFRSLGSDFIGYF